MGNSPHLQGANLGLHHEVTLNQFRLWKNSESMKFDQTSILLELILFRLSVANKLDPSEKFSQSHYNPDRSGQTFTHIHHECHCNCRLSLNCSNGGMIAQHTCLMSAENNNWVQSLKLFLNCLDWPPTQWPSTSHQTQYTVSETVDHDSG